jgi:hypothetical protein
MFRELSPRGRLAVIIRKQICGEAPSSIPARHPSLGPAGRKLFAQMQESLSQLRKKDYPAGEHPEEE